MAKPPDVAPFLPPRRSLENPTCRVVLVEPLIPENTGNISRTCVGTNSELHLVKPLGFELTESRVKRAGLDYWNHLALDIHEDFAAFATHARNHPAQSRIYFVETWGTTSLHDATFHSGDWVIFGKETTGLTREQVESIAGGPENVLRLPMPGEIRSLNLSNAVAVTVFEILRQVTR